MFNRLKRKLKYDNQPSQCRRGHSHRSGLEIAVCELLSLRERAGELKLLQCEDHVYLTRARILYIPDFRCLDLKTNETFWVEAKGFETPVWLIKKKLWKFYGPGRLEIWKGSAARVSLAETIQPDRETK